VPATRAHFEATLDAVDPALAALLGAEAERQEQRLELVASENHVSHAQLEASGCILGNTTVEGYPGARFLGASLHVDAVERLAISRACQVFGSRFANVQPHSGTQANQAVFLALLVPGDTVLSMSLAAGGHFSHGEPSNLSGLWFHAVHYGVDAKSGRIDYDEAERQAHAHRPKLIIAGASAYPRAIDFARFAAIAHSVGAHLMVDIAHVAGLVASDLFPNPFPHAHIVTSTTYKNFRGVRGGLILCNDPALAARIDAAICPGLQGTPMLNLIAGKAVAFLEALQPAYRTYSRQVLANARALASALERGDIAVLTGGTDTPFVIADLRPLGSDASAATRLLDGLRIGVSGAPVPGDAGGLVRAAGIRLGVSSLTTRGMRETECEKVGDIIAHALRAGAGAGLDGGAAAALSQEVSALCTRFPLYGASAA
jgi:glycine hydroxymethyltransferase